MSNYNVIKEPKSVPIKMWTKGVHVDDNSIEQLKLIASMPFIKKHVAVMPDVHLGIGATIGSVIPTTDVIIPASVGVDIGCGMNATLTNLTAADLPDNLFSVRDAIEKAVPHGRTVGRGQRDKGSWGSVPEIISKIWEVRLKSGFDRILAKHEKPLKKANSSLHLGTLGTGNHFIEICLDERDRVWIMLHSGSRGVGNAIGRHFIDLAKKDMERFYVRLPDKDLSYLIEGTDHFKDYIESVDWAQNFAFINREIMTANTLTAVSNALGKITTTNHVVINCHHNYVKKERHFMSDVWITRKGAVNASVGKLGIIPGSMGAKSFIVRGLGNPDSFNSCSHGAGRVMSRAEAKRRVDLDTHKKAVAGVECRIDEDVIDETPSAYKDIDAVMDAQKDLVEIVHTLHQVVCVKG